ncbi:carbohydrate ABC transporter permease [Bacillus sp. 3255]|uniref:carbohydrate ABC transporter permease n=1 Tax=Bacillus sp. 3255 TaxID=2817904 RepID=UPI002864CA92|nr:carbohydrate ABC transporter permease [Bacillus sp. 3255]MDR6880814.1 putative aldouronate transport system permease protein [Bacillus sp. 3255]
MVKKSTGSVVFDACNVIALSLLVVITAYPLLYVVIASFSNSELLVSHTGLLFKPLGFQMEAYKLVLSNPNILSGYRNTLVVVIGGTLLSLFLTALGAYGLSRKGLMFGRPLMIAVVFTMFFSGGLIPTYLLVYNTLHLGNNLLALVLPTAISTWNLIVLRTAFAAIPESLIESAKMDGAGEYTVLFRIVIPLAMPAMAVMILFYGVGHWNAWFSAMIYLRDRELYPLQLIMREILLQNSVDSMTSAASGADDKYSIGESIKYATIVVATAPILFVYPFLQKYFAKGVMIGAIKE